MPEDAIATKQKRPPGAPKGNNNAGKSGRYALASRLKQSGFSVLTRRQRELVSEWRSAIEADAGGQAQLSQLKRLQLERYLVTEVLLQSLDNWLLQQKSIINRRKKSLYPIILERNRLIETSLKLATAIGLERRPREGNESLATHVAKEDARKAAAAKEGPA